MKNSDRSRRSVLCIALGLVALSAACFGPAVAEEKAPPSSDKRAPLQVNAGGLRDHVEFLARDELIGRDSGEPGLEVAAEYIANFYAKYGLEPAGDNGTYFQHFTVPAGAAFGREAGARVTLEGGAKVRWNAGADVEAFGFRDPALIDAPIVFAGYGITTSAADKRRGLEYDDYAGIDVKDKVVIILRFTPRNKANENPFKAGRRTSPHAPFTAKLENARKRGAVGVVFVTPSGHPDEDPYGISHRASPKQPTLPALYVSRSALNVVLRTQGSTISRLVKKIDEELKPASFEIKGAKIRFSTTRRHLRLRNVAGRLGGSDPKLKSETIVIGGHYDHIGRFGGQVFPAHVGEIHNGADDNASGTAGILELARLLAAGERPRRSFEFVAFSGEEIGLLGSRYWVNTAHRRFVLTDWTRALEGPPNPHGGESKEALVWEAGTQVSATGSFQGGLIEVRTLAGTSGWVKSSALRQVAGPTPIHQVIAMINLDMIGRGQDGKPVTVLGARSSDAFPPMLEEFSKVVGQPLNLAKGMGSGGSDHFHFLRKRIPYLFFFTGIHSLYNKPGDDLETLNIGVQANIIDVAWKSAVHIANTEKAPTFSANAQTSPHGNTTPAQGRPTLGIFSDPNYDGDGVRITGTVDDTPAGRSDLEAGDVILSFAGAKTKDLAALRAALDKKPEGDVELEIMRGDQKRKLVVSFPRRSGGFRVSFGSIPDYGFSEKGVRFDDIRPNTAAAKAGVKAGDILLKWGAEEVRDVEHWTQLLRNHKPDDKVPLEIQRGDKTVKLTVTLEGR